MISDEVAITLLKKIIQAIKLSPFELSLVDDLEERGLVEYGPGLGRSVCNAAKLEWSPSVFITDEGFTLSGLK